MVACKSALSARLGKTRQYTNVVCCSLKILPSSSALARCGGAIVSPLSRAMVSVEQINTVFGPLQIAWKGPHNVSSHLQHPSNFYNHQTGCTAGSVYKPKTVVPMRTRNAVTGPFHKTGTFGHFLNIVSCCLQHANNVYKKHTLSMRYQLSYPCAQTL